MCSLLLLSRRSEYSIKAGAILHSHSLFYKALLFIKSVGRQPGKPTVDRKTGKTSRSGEAFRML